MKEVEKKGKGKTGKKIKTKLRQLKNVAMKRRIDERRAKNGRKGKE